MRWMPENQIRKQDKEVRTDMITLKVMDRCQNCPEFKAEAQMEIFYSLDSVTETNVEIKCKNEPLCNFIQEFLKKENEGSEKR